MKTWEERCYFEIPDEIPEKLSRTGRVPSYKAIAMAVLRNDWKSLGIHYSNETVDRAFKKEDRQMQLELG